MSSLVTKINDLLSVIDDEPTSVDENEQDLDADYDDEEEEYILYYWPLRNRGNFIRLLFAIANIPYEDVSDFKSISSFFGWNSQQNDDSKENDKDSASSYVPFAPPALKVIDGKNEFVFCQTVPIVLYLAETFDLLPNGKYDRLRAHEWTENINDLIVELYHQNYSELKGAKCRRCKLTPEQMNEWIDSRLYRFLNPMEQHLKNRNQEQNLYFFDGEVSYFDLMCFNIMDALNELFGSKYDEIVKEKCPCLHKHFIKIGIDEYVERLLEKQKENKMAWFWLPDGSWKATKKMMGWE